MQERLVECGNIYPLVHASHFYDGITKARPNLRPYMLTRCAWASQQKWGTAVWSGDIPTTFEELQKQVAAGLNFTATGIPYWTTDIGGYSGGDPSKKDYQELFIRWFQYGTFCPIFVLMDVVIREIRKLRMSYGHMALRYNVYVPISLSYAIDFFPIFILCLIE